MTVYPEKAVVEKSLVDLNHFLVASHFFLRRISHGTPRKSTVLNVGFFSLGLGSNGTGELECDNLSVTLGFDWHGYIASFEKEYSNA